MIDGIHMKLDTTDNNNKLINSFDYPTTISPDTKNSEIIYLTSTLEYSDKINELIDKYDMSKKNILLAIFLFNLVKFSFSKDILISYNRQAAGYHFDTNSSVSEYINDFKSKYEDCSDDEEIKLESEILFATGDYSKEDYKFILAYDDEKITVEYDSSIYSKELIGTFLHSLNVLIDRFNNEKELLKDISIVEDIDMDEDFKIELANEGLINRIFENAVEENPDKTILYATDANLTYSQLNSKANRIANGLIQRGVDVEDKVMFMMKRNSDLIATVLGIVKAGAAFIPIDPKYPEKRINQILEDSDSKYVITSDDIDYDGENRINVDELLETTDDSNPDVNLNPDNLCFLIYTSGSTGKPKGVMITHKGISNYIANVEENQPIYQLNHECEKFI